MTTYTITELGGQAREKALNWLAEVNVDHEWWDAVYEDAERVARLLGIDIERNTLQFSGFWSQGDGASFEGMYEFAPDAVDAIQEYAPNDAELLQIAKSLTVLGVWARLGPNIDLAARIERTTYTRSVHEQTMTLYLLEQEDTGVTFDELVGHVQAGKVEQRLLELMRRFARWIYRQLEKEYMYLTSEEACLEAAEANEYVFDEEGELV